MKLGLLPASASLAVAVIKRNESKAINQVM
jgi:hypothetical protein